MSRLDRHRTSFYSRKLQGARRERADELVEPPEMDVVEAHRVRFVQLE